MHACTAASAPCMGSSWELSSKHCPHRILYALCCTTRRRKKREKKLECFSRQKSRRCCHLQSCVTSDGMSCYEGSSEVKTNLSEFWYWKHCFHCNLWMVKKYGSKPWEWPSKGCNVIYSGLCEGEKENGAGEKKMLAAVDFFLLFSLIPTFFQPQEIFFHWFLLLKLWIFSYRRNKRIFVSRGRVQGFILSRGTTKPNLRDRINPCTLPRDTKIIWFLRYETISKF